MRAVLVLVVWSVFALTGGAAKSAPCKSDYFGTAHCHLGPVDTCEVGVSSCLGAALPDCHKWVADVESEGYCVSSPGSGTQCTEDPNGVIGRRRTYSCINGECKFLALEVENGVRPFEIIDLTCNP